MSGEYTLGTWRDMTTYKCTLCAFDCLDKEQALEHYRAHFIKPPEPKDSRPVTLAIDDSGHVIVAPSEPPAPSEPSEPVPAPAPKKRRKRKEI